MMSNNVENGFLEIHSPLWVTSRLGRNKIESTKVRATRLISDWKNAPIYSVSKAYKKSEGERNTHSDNADQAVFFFSPTSFWTLNFLLFWAASCLLAFSSDLSISEHLLSSAFFLTSLPVSAHRGCNKLKGSQAQNSWREAPLPSLKAQITCTKYPWDHGSQKDKRYTMFIAKNKGIFECLGLPGAGQQLLINSLVCFYDFSAHFSVASWWGF